MVGPSSGTCAPGCVVALNWLFDPIVPEPLDVRVPVHVGSGSDTQISELHVWGNGTMQHPPLQLLERRAERSVTLGCVIPQSPALRLLDPSIDLGIAAPHGLLRTFVVLESSSSRDVAFQWDAGELSGEGASEGRISFEPPAGMLCPGERLGCLVSYQAGSEHQFLEAEVALVIAEGDETSVLDDQDAGMQCRAM